MTKSTKATKAPKATKIAKATKTVTKAIKATLPKLITASGFKPNVTFKGGSLRSQWLANMLHCNMITLSKGGLVAKTGKANTAQVKLCWQLLKVPHHCRLENYDNANGIGITSKGIKAISSKPIDYPEVMKMLTAVSAKTAPKGYMEVSISTRA